MKICILTEGGKAIGLGHITRCGAIRQAFKDRGILVALIVNAQEDIRTSIGDEDYQVFNWIKERERLQDFVSNSDILIVDSYLADRSLYVSLSSMARVPVYLDDTKRLDYPKGVVVNGSFYARDLDYPQEAQVQYVMGAEYIILKKEFWHAPDKEIKKDIESVMVTFGGADTKNLTPKILDFLNAQYPHAQKFVIIGKSFQNITNIEMSAGKNTRIVYFPISQRMKEIMQIADIAVSSGGQTLYELLRVGVPTLGICVAENQRIGLEKFYKMELIEYAGGCDDEDIIDQLKCSISRLIPQGIREERSKKGRALVDGKGCERLIDRLMAIKV